MKRGILGLLALFAAACGSSGGPEPTLEQIASVEISGGDIVFNALTKSRTLEAVARTADGNAVRAPNVSWSSDAPDVVSVGATGVATARSVGTAVITVSVDDVSATVNAEVRQVLASVTITLPATTLVGKGSEARATAVGRDSAGQNIPDLAFVFSSSDETVVTIDQEGLATAIDFGAANVAAETGGITGELSVLVAPGLNYAAWFGGGPAGTWDAANFNVFKATVPNLVSTYRSTNIYNKPVNPELNRAVAQTPPPDVISGPIAGGLWDDVAAGRIADITDLWIEQGWESQFPESLKEMVSKDGRRYFVPQALQWNPIFYNRRVFGDLGLAIPTTWDELLATCDAINAAGRIPITVSVGWSPPVARWFTTLNLRLNGYEFHERLMRGQERYDDPRVRAVFDRWAELFDRGCFASNSASNSYNTAVSQLSSGTAAMWNIGEWVYESFAGKANSDLDFFVFPTIDSTVQQAEIVHVYGAFMTTGARNPDQARQFLSYLGSAQSQRSNATALQRVVSNMTVDPGIYSTVRRKGSDLVSQVPHATPLFEVATAPSMSQLGLNVFVQFWNNHTPSAIDGYLAQLESQRAAIYP